MRIYSFLPSATEIVYALGLQDQLYGVTFECDSPPEARTKPIVVRSIFGEAQLSDCPQNSSRLPAVPDPRRWESSHFTARSRLFERTQAI
jgi:ABC-type hemin transport system substrate-binding protein